MRKKEPLKEEDFYNYWLGKYHNTTVQEIIEKDPELCKTSKWYKKYQVTQEQHDEWYEWAIKTIMNHHRCSRKRAQRNFMFDYLNLAPMVKTR